MNGAFILNLSVREHAAGATVAALEDWLDTMTSPGSAVDLLLVISRRRP